MSYEQAMKYFPPGKKPSREEWEAAIKELEGLDLPSPSFNYPIPYGVYFLEAKKAEEERRHQEILAALTARSNEEQPTPPVGRPREGITQWAIKQLDMGRDPKDVRAEYIARQPGANLNSLIRQFRRIKNQRTH